MAWFGAAYATDENHDKYKGFSEPETQSANTLNQSLGGQGNALAAGQQVQQNAQANSIGLANSARGGRGNSMMRSAMLQAPVARQAGLQAQYQQQQANFQNAAAMQDFESQRRAGIEADRLGHFKAEDEQALAQQRDTNNQIEAIGGMMSAAGGAAASDRRMKNVLGGKYGASSPQVVIMIGCGEHEHGGYDIDDDEEDEDDAGDDAVEAMRELEPSTFEYKPEFKGAPGAGDGEYTGIMAQDLEKTPAGKGTVSMGPDGMRRVDGAKLATLNSAALSKVVKDMDRLKGSKRA